MENSALCIEGQEEDHQKEEPIVWVSEIQGIAEVLLSVVYLKHTRSTSIANLMKLPCRKKS